MTRERVVGFVVVVAMAILVLQLSIRIDRYFHPAPVERRLPPITPRDCPGMFDNRGQLKYCPQGQACSCTTGEPL